MIILKIFVPMKENHAGERVDRIETPLVQKCRPSSYRGLGYSSRASFCTPVPKGELP